MSMEGYALLEDMFALAERLRESINATGVFQVLELQDMQPSELEDDNIQLDPSKLTVDISGSGLSADSVQLELFEKYNIQVEKTTFNTITLLLTIGTTLGKVMRLENALKRMARRTAEGGAGLQLTPPPPLPAFGEICRLPRDVFFELGETCASDGCGRSAQPSAGRRYLGRPDHTLPAGNPGVGSWAAD